MNKILRTLISIIFILLVVLPLALLGTCSLFGGGALILNSVFSGSFSQIIGGIILGIFLVIVGYFIIRFANKMRKK